MHPKSQLHLPGPTQTGSAMWWPSLPHEEEWRIRLLLLEVQQFLGLLTSRLWTQPSLFTKSLDCVALHGSLSPCCDPLLGSQHG
jgi:hypothetical protein